MRLNSLFTKQLLVILVVSFIAIAGTLAIIKRTIIDGFGDENPVMKTRDFLLFEQVLIEFYKEHGSWRLLIESEQHKDALRSDFQAKLYELRKQFPEDNSLHDEARLRPTREQSPKLHERPPRGERPPKGERPPRGDRPPHGKHKPPHARGVDYPGIEPPTDPDTLLGPLIGPGPDNMPKYRGERGLPSVNPIFPPPILLDNRMRWISGKASGNLRMRNLKPMTLGGEVIGFIGFDFSHLTSFATMRLEQEQDRVFPQIIIGMGIISLILAAIFAYLLVKPIRRLTQGTKQISQGNYYCNIEVISADELGDLSKDFNQMATSLTASRDSRQKFIADIAHEIRTPLAVMKSQLEALADGVRKPTPEAFAKLDNRVNQLNRLIGDLYELSKYDVGALNYQKEPVSLVEVLEETLDSFDQEFSQNELTIECEIGVKPSFIIEADVERLSQLFANLLTNAKRYTDKGGKVKVKAYEEHNQAMIVFQDTPPGVADDELDKIFEQLYRSEGANIRASDGSGLGLALCKSIVKAHAGTIEAGHSPMGGIEIRIALPL